MVVYVVLIRFDGAFRLAATVLLAEWQAVLDVRGTKFAKSRLTREGVVDVLFDQAKLTNFEPSGRFIISDVSDQTEPDGVFYHLTVPLSLPLVTPEPNHPIRPFTLPEPAACFNFLVSHWICSSSSSGCCRDCTLGRLRQGRYVLSHLTQPKAPLITNATNWIRTNNREQTGARVLWTGLVVSI